MKRSVLQLSSMLAFGTYALSAQAAVLYNGDRLSIHTGIANYDTNGIITNVATGSWFGCDCNGNYAITGNEKTPLSQGTEGIIIGAIQPVGSPSHGGTVTPSDWNRIDAPYNFFGNTGQHFTTSPITGSTTSGLDFSGWNWTWSGISTIYMGTWAWGEGFTNGIANFAWDGIYSHNYTLDYHARVPNGDPSGIGGIPFAYHLEGTVQCMMTPEGGCTNNPLPIPAAAWLFGSGLIALAGAARRRKG